MKHKTKAIQPTKAHEDLRMGFVKACQQHPNMPPIEMLCIAAQFVGQLIALQDQTRWTSEQILAMVGMNMEQGNKAAIENIFGATKGPMQ